MSTPSGIRTCSGCLGKAHFKELFKFPKGFGRHGYLHLNEDCFKKAVKKNAFSFVLRRKLTEEEQDEIKRDFYQKLKSAAPAGGNGDGARGPRQNLDS